MTQAMRVIARHWYLSYSKLMSLRWEESARFPYAGTDGRTLWLNPEGIEKLATHNRATEMVAFMLVHESLHALLGHGWRLAKMPDEGAAQQAADYVVNALIVARNRELRRELFVLPEGALLDESLSGDKSVEQLYRELTRPQPPQPQPEPNEQQDKQDNSEGPSDGDSSDDEGSPEGGEADPSGTPQRGCAATPPASLPSGGTGDGGDDPAEPVGGGDNGNGQDPVGPDDFSNFVGNGAPDSVRPEADHEAGETESEVTDQIEEDNDRILIANELDSRAQSDGGTTGQRLAAMRTDGTKLDWVDLTREWVQRRTRNGWDSPFNAAIHGSTGLVCAGRQRKSAGTVVLVLDTSGSIGAATYAKFLQQGQAILDELKPEQLVLLSVSHVVADAVTLEAGDTVPTSLKGGGGTAFKPAFDWVARNDIQPEFMLYLTDGYSSDLSTLQPVDFPLLWLSTSVAANKFPIGDVLEITNI